VQIFIGGVGAKLTRERRSHSRHGEAAVESDERDQGCGLGGEVMSDEEIKRWKDLVLAWKKRADELEFKNAALEKQIKELKNGKKGGGQ